MKKHRIQRAILGFAVALGGIVVATAGSTQYSVIGTVTIKGNTGPLPAGGTFGPSGYDSATGALSTGAFAFPQSTYVQGGSSVTYRLEQTDTSAGQIASDGVAALTNATFKLTVISAVYNGLPVPVGSHCVFQPIVMGLSGAGSSTQLDLADTQFDIPPVASTACGGFGSQVNDGIAGSENRIAMHLEGDFTPPTNSDLIFANGFE